MYQGEFRDGLSARQSFRPSESRFAQGLDIHSGAICRRPGQVPGCSSQHGLCAGPVPAAVVVQPDSYLDHPLQEQFLLRGRGTPHVLQHLVGFEELATIEQLDPVPEALPIHDVEFIVGTQAAGPGSREESKSPLLRGLKPHPNLLKKLAEVAGSSGRLK